MKLSVRLFAVLRVFTLCLVVSLHRCHSADSPKYLEERLNITAILGRNVTFVCKVQDLAPYRVAWLCVDTQTILVIDTHVITKNHRVAARHFNDDWIMIIKEVVPRDGGLYMCQINTDPMMSQTYTLNIVEPPNIDDKGSTNDIIVKEGESASMVCAASGVPPPSFTWRREDSNLFTINNTTVTKWSGEWLNMSRVERTHSGAYLCIATNGVPPSVSKRILLNVMFAPTMKASRAGIRALASSAPTLQCTAEAYPLPTIYWTFNDNQRLMNGSHYAISTRSVGYRHVTSLCVLSMGALVTGEYRCHADNTLGAAHADILLHLLTTTTTTTTTSTTASTITTTTVAPHTTTQFEPGDAVDLENAYIAMSPHQMQNLEISSSM